MQTPVEMETRLRPTAGRGARPDRTFVEFAREHTRLLYHRWGLCDENDCVEAAARPRSHRPDGGPAPLAGTGAVVVQVVRILTSRRF